jgi:hypothetical protein
MKTISKALVGTIAAGAMAMTSSPAYAQFGGNRDRNDGIDVGDVIAGALIIGGIAAVAGAVGNNRNRGYNNGGGYVYEGNGNVYNNDGYNYNGYGAGDSRSAVEQCVYAAENNANRYSYGGRSQVTDIRNIDRKRDGYTVKGRIAVNTRNSNWQRGWNNDYRGYNNQYSGYDSGNFTCKVRYGQVYDLDYSGIRGL